MALCLIYLLTNRENGKRYVGQTWRPLRKRLGEHATSSCRKLVAALAKYGASSFDSTVLTVAHTQEIADYWERRFIGRYDSIKAGYNLREGGSCGRHTEETRRKMSVSRKGRPMCASAYEKLCERTRNLSPERSAQLATQAVHAREVRLARGTSDETRARMSAAQRGRTHSEETRAKLSLILKGNAEQRAAKVRGRRHTPESIEKMRVAALIREAGKRLAAATPVVSPES